MLSEMPTAPALMQTHSTPAVTGEAVGTAWEGGNLLSGGLDWSTANTGILTSEQTSPTLNSGIKT